MMSSSPWIFWLVEIPVLAILLYSTLLIIDSIVAASTGKSKLWFRQDITDDFPYPDECWICNRTDCVGCPILEEEEK